MTTKKRRTMSKQAMTSRQLICFDLSSSAPLFKQNGLALARSGPTPVWATLRAHHTGWATISPPARAVSTFTGRSRRGS